MDKKNLFSWIVLGVAIWLTLGSILFPDWFYGLFFRGEFWNPQFWFGGIRDILVFIFFKNPILLVSVIILYFLAKKKIIDIKIPKLDFFSSLNKATTLIILSVIVALLIWFLPYNTVHGLKIGTNDEYPPSESVETKVTIPLDFIYINKERVDNLFEQIKPELILKEKQLEKQVEEGKEISSGENPIINSKRSEKKQNKQTDTYASSEISEPQKVTDLLNHFYSLNAINEFQTLELSADDVTKLESFKTISNQFQIGYDKTKFSQVYNRVIGESLIKEHSTMKTLTGQVVIKGNFLVSISSDKILLKHNYIEIDDKNRITFNVSTLNKTEKLSTTLSDEGQNNKTMNLNIFGKITRVEAKEKVTDIYFDAYAIW